MADRRKKTYIIGIAVAFLLPLFTFLIVYKLSDGVLRVPKHYGISYIDTVKTAAGKIKIDTFYRAMKELKLTNQLGKKVTLNKDLRGKILVINFFNTTDSTISPVMMGNMKLLEQSYKKNAGWVQFISITDNPKHDKVAQIRAYFDKLKANSDHWWLLTGDSSNIYNYAGKQLGLDVEPVGGKETIPFDRIVLVDTFRQIRGYYNGMDTFQLRNLADNISILTLEKPNY